MFLLSSPFVYAAEIELGDNCSLSDGIISSNRNVSYGGCQAGELGQDIIIFAQATEIQISDSFNNAALLPAIRS